MDISFIDLFLHLDALLSQCASQYGTGIYAILFAIIFLETGMLPFPFLPGDSLLFVAGALAASPDTAVDVKILMLLLIFAAIFGNLFNYATGIWLGNRLFANPDSRFFKRRYLEKTEAFYIAHGRKTTLIARFVPIVRTFAPFVAGMARMPFSGFFVFTVVGAVIWVVSLVYAGFLFGNVPLVRDNLSKIIIIGIVGSLAIASLGALRKQLKRKAAC